MKKCLFALSALILTFSVLSAQPPQPPRDSTRPAPPKIQTPEEIAKEQADMMREELGITDKQYKKVYNLIKKDYESRQQGQGSGDGFPPPPGGMGGGPGMGGGMPMGGGPGMGGGMPPMGGGPGMDQGGGNRPPKPEGFEPGYKPVTEEYLEKQEEKLKKILTPEQYEKWRANHPSEIYDLPPLEFEMK